MPLCTPHICTSACREDSWCIPCSCLSAYREGKGCTPCTGISACREGRGCTSSTCVSTCREGMTCTPSSGVSPCRGGRACTPRSPVSACRETRGCTPRDGFSASRGGKGCTPRRCVSPCRASITFVPSLTGSRIFLISSTNTRLVTRASRCAVVQHEEQRCHSFEVTSFVPRNLILPFCSPVNSSSPKRNVAQRLAQLDDGPRGGGRRGWRRWRGGRGEARAYDGAFCGGCPHVPSKSHHTRPSISTSR